VCGKRLEKGRFTWPSPQDPAGGKVRLSAARLAMLLGGIDLGRAKSKAWLRENE
jgi:transposase